MLTSQVVSSSAQYAGSHSGTHYFEFIGDGVQKFNCVTAFVVNRKLQFIESTGINEAVAHYFVHANCNHVVLNAIFNIFNYKLTALCHAKYGHMGFNVIQAVDTSDFFTNICIAGNIITPAGSSDYQVFTIFSNFEFQRSQGFNHFFFRNSNTYTTADNFRSYFNYSRFYFFRICFYDTCNGFASTHLFQKISSAVQCIVSFDGVYTTFETTTCFTAEAQGTGSTTDGRTMEACSFEHYINGFTGNFGIITTHYATKTNSAFSVADNNHGSIKSAFLFVQSHQFFTFAATTNNQSVVYYFIIVISMHGLTKFKHNIVGYVNYVADGTHTTSTQAFLHPFRGFSNFNVFQYANCKARAKFRSFNFDGSHFCNITTSSFCYVHCRHFQGATGKSCNFTSQTDNAEAVCTVSSQVNIDNNIVQAKYFFNINANGSISRKNEDAFALCREKQFVVNAKFVSTAKHTERIQATHFYSSKFHTFRVTAARRQSATYNCNGNDIVLFYVLSTGQNLYDALAVIHLANPQMVRVRMTFDLGNFTGQNAFQTFAKIGYGFNFQASTGDFVHQYIDRNIYINILFKPFQRC